jgi:uncharacterized protein (DUF952 family)
MLIYKILRSDEWAALQDAGQTQGAPIDVADGYVHFSTAAQAGETASKWFAGVEDLWLLAYDADSLGDALKWEPSRGGDLFPPPVPRRFAWTRQNGPCPCHGTARNIVFLRRI